MDGFSDFTDDHMATLRDAQANIILIAMGCPHQDEFLQRLANALPSGIGIGVGVFLMCGRVLLNVHPLYFEY